jgi:hypothetical protein
LLGFLRRSKHPGGKAVLWRGSLDMV